MLDIDPVSDLSNEMAAPQVIIALDSQWWSGTLAELHQADAEPRF